MSRLSRTPPSTANVARRTQGFSLIELVIVMVLTALLAVISMQPLLQAFQARATVSGNLSAIDSLRFTTERLVRELRQVRYDAQGSGFQLKALDPIAGTFSASSGLCFVRVGGADGKSLAQQAVRIISGNATLDSVSFPGCTAVQPQILAQSVTSLRFDYWTYGSAGSGQPQPTSLSVTDPNFGKLLAFIDITLSVNATNGAPASYRTRVVLRNGAWGAYK